LSDKGQTKTSFGHLVLLFVRKEKEV